MKANEACRVPRRHIFLDTEAGTERLASGHRQTWRCAVACYRVAEKGRPARERWAEYDQPAHLWREVDVHCGRSARTVLWAHNLGYDVRISDAFRYLPALGWKLVAHNLVSRGTWFRWVKGRATLMMVDSGSVYPTTLAKVGAAFGMGKLDLPDEDDSMAAWMARCRRDVEILRQGVVTYLDWIEAEDLGNWQVTGAGMASTVYRHKFMTYNILVHGDAQALAAERRALWAGRCEAYWRGEMPRQVLHEWDFSLAYARLCRTLPLPVRYLGPMPAGYDWMGVLQSERTALLAEIDIQTDVPVVPAEVDGRIAWPIGRFRTVVWDLELAAAIEAGAKVTVIRGWLYRTRPALAAWADWIVSTLDGVHGECPAWLEIVLHSWSRSVIGHFAMTYSGWEQYAESPIVDVRQSTCYDRRTGETSTLLQVGTTVFESTGRQESPNSCPAITGYVQSAQRVRMWRVLRALPKEAVLYVDTDSVLCTDKWMSTVDAVAKSTVGDGLRVKRSWQGFSIWGPRQIVTGTLVRVSGLPKKARRVDRTHFDGEIWESVSAALRRGDPAAVVTRDRQWTIRGVDHRRVGPDLGWTHPIRIERGDADAGRVAELTGVD